MRRTDPYIFRTPRRLIQAKADLYGWLAINGSPASGTGPRPKDFDPESPIRAALNALYSHDESKRHREDSLDYLRLSIYVSELEHGVSDHFDDRLYNFGQPAPSREDSTSLVSGHNAFRSTGNPKGRSAFVRAIRLVLVASLILAAIAALAFWRETHVSAARIEKAVQAHSEAVAALSVSLPRHYAACYSAQKTIGCATGAPASRTARADIENAMATTARLIGAFANSPFVALHAAPLLTTTSASACGSEISESAWVERVLHGLCLGRVRLIEHLLCVDGEEPGNGANCHDMARLGIAGTRFESDAARDLPRPVNVFSMPLELTDELTRLAALADLVSDGPDLSEIAESFLARYLSIGPNSATEEWIASIWTRVIKP